MRNMMKNIGFIGVGCGCSECADLQASYKPAGSACNSLFLLVELQPRY
jgi:hypothetical protein